MKKYRVEEDQVIVLTFDALEDLTIICILLCILEYRGHSVFAVAPR